MTRMALACLLAASTVLAQHAGEAPAATRIVRFTPPTSRPERVTHGDCPAASIAAGFRADALQCTAGNTIYDPCFLTARAGHVLCDVDPRESSSGMLLATTPAPAARAGTPAPDHLAWFFELTDGSTCRPLTGTRREIDGTREIYGCRFGSSGDADAVLGDLDAGTAVWTIQKVLLNKKVEPQTIKSLMVVPVKTVWQ